MKKKLLFIGVLVITISIIIVFCINKSKRNSSSNGNTEDLITENLESSEEVIIYDEEGNIRGVAYNETDKKMFEEDASFYMDMEAPALYRTETAMQEIENMNNESSDMQE